MNIFKNKPAVPWQRCSDTASNKLDWPCHWLSLLTLCIILSLGVGFSSDTQAGSRKGSCGGKDQRPCTVTPTWVGGDGMSPSCDPGLKEDFVKNKCVGRPSSCGHENQRPCTIAEFVPSCESDLVEDVVLRWCIKKGNCGTENQRPCTLAERSRSCDSGLYEDAKPEPRNSMCRKLNCGALNQRPCTVAEKIPSCDTGLAQDFLQNKCVDDEIGKIVVDVFDATGKVIGQCTGGVDKCADQVRQGYLAAGTAVIKLGRPVVNEAGKIAIKGLQEAEKLGKKVMEAALKPIAEDMNKQFAGPFIGLAKAWTEAVTADEYARLKTAIEEGDGPATACLLEAIFVKMVNNSPFRDAIAAFQSKNYGSFLILPTVSGGAGVVGAKAILGVAIDVDWVAHVIKKVQNQPSTYDYDAQNQGLRVLSFVAAAGLQVGPTAGASGGVDVGYHIAGPHGVGGPSIDVGVTAKTPVGGGVGVGFDASKLPPQVVTAAVGFGAGAEVKLGIGPSFTYILAQLCHDYTVVGGITDCPNRGEEPKVPTPPAACPAGIGSGGGTDPGPGPGTGSPDPAPNPGGISPVSASCTPSSTKMLGFAAIKKFELTESSTNASVFANNQTVTTLPWVDFTGSQHPVIQLNQNTTYDYVVNKSNVGLSEIWIDKNNDGNFVTGSDERIAFSGTPVDPRVAGADKGTLTIPANLPAGYYRLRLRAMVTSKPGVMAYASDDPCLVDRWGFSQVYDYKLQVLPQGGSL